MGTPTNQHDEVLEAIQHLRGMILALEGPPTPGQWKGLMSFYRNNLKWPGVSKSEAFRALRKAMRADPNIKREGRFSIDRDHPALKPTFLAVDWTNEEALSSPLLPVYALNMLTSARNRVRGSDILSEMALKTAQALLDPARRA